MEEMVTAKDFRLKFTKMCEKVLNGKSFIVVKHSRPIFRVDPISKNASDLLDRVSSIPAQSPSLEEINGIVHKIRREIQ